MGSCNILGAFSSGGGGNGGGVTPNLILGTFNIHPAYSTYAVRYGALFTEQFVSASASVTESQVQAPIHFAFQLNRVFMNVNSNSMNGDTIIGIRDDGSTIGSVTIGNDATGEFITAALEVDVASGSDVNWIVDSTASSSGNIQSVRAGLAYGQSI